MEITEQHVTAFTQLVLAPDHAESTDAFEAMISAGHSLESLFLDLLAPSAALLGRMWDNDLCDFVAVTTGVARLQILLSTFRETATGYDAKRRALLLAAPREQHTFGIAIVEQLMSAAGWQVVSGFTWSAEESTDLVTGEWFGIVGLTLGCDTRLDELAASVSTIRRCSKNPRVGVMVGGPVFVERPELAFTVGADASAFNAPTAVLLAERLLDGGQTPPV